MYRFLKLTGRREHLTGRVWFDYFNKEKGIPIISELFYFLIVYNIVIHNHLPQLYRSSPNFGGNQAR